MVLEIFNTLGTKLYYGILSAGDSYNIPSQTSTDFARLSDLQGNIIDVDKF